MVPAPYWVAARIYSVAASPTGRARISGSYALSTGRDLDDLHPKLYLDVVEAWLWEHFTDQDDADRWIAELETPPSSVWGEIRQLAARATAVAVGEFLTVFHAGRPDEVDAAPPGWDNQSLMAQFRASTGGAGGMVID